MVAMTYLLFLVIVGDFSGVLVPMVVLGANIPHFPIFFFVGKSPDVLNHGLNRIKMKVIGITIKHTSG